MEGQRGRKSASELTVMPLRAVAVLERPAVPAHLAPEEGREWREIVAALPADHFPRETWGMLEAYCRHIVCHRKVGALIRQLESEGGELRMREWERLLGLQQREGAAMTLLARAMRLSQHSRMDKGKLRPKLGIEKPWG